MRIRSCDIKGFGRFNHLKITPSPGFNIIYEANEGGKSTLQAFFHAMLFGFKSARGRRAKDASTFSLMRYRPWNSEQYAGIMEYTLENGEWYRVGRNFEKGTVNIYDSNANNIGSLFEQDRETGPKFAEAHLGIDKFTFEQSVFIRQLHTSIDEAGRKSIIEKISNLNRSGNEDISVSKALETLDATLLERVGTERTTTRPLDLINARLNDLEALKRELLSRNEQYLETAKERYEKKENLKRLKESLEELEQKKELILKTRLHLLMEELSQLKKEEYSLDKDINSCLINLEGLKSYESMEGGMVTKAEMLVHSIEETRRALDMENKRLEELHRNNELLVQSLETEDIFQSKVRNIEAALEEKNCVEGQKGFKSKVLPTFFISATAILMALVYFYLTTQSLGFLIAGFLDIVLLLAGLLWSFKYKKMQNGHPADNLNQILQDYGFDGLSEFLEYRETQIKQRDLLEYNVEQISEAQNRISELELKLERDSTELKKILEGAWVDYAKHGFKAGVEELNRGLEKHRGEKHSLELLMTKKTSLTDQIEVKRREIESLQAHIKGIEDIDRSGMVFDSTHATDIIKEQGRIEEQIALKRNEINEVMLDLAALNARIENTSSQGEISNVIEEITSLMERKETLEKAGRALALASETIRDITLKRQRDYIPILNDKMSKIVNTITLDRYNRVSTNDSFEIQVETRETEELVPITSMSSGTIDQIYLAMRIASIELLEKEKEPLPLFLDEAFSQYDETRLRSALELLKVISNERQVFFFTCKEREFQMAHSIFGDSMYRIKL